ncbi:MAG: phage holin family protein [Oscillospiraceae bacterium]|jgi:toxin secretion/phage lysis holin|nr:phage holin family protein [Oscillospiraceae bacterium]
MEQLHHARLAVCSFVGAAGGIIANLFGGWSSDLTTLVIFMAVDFLTGLLTAALSRSRKTAGGGLSSAVGWQGLMRKIMTLMLVMAAYRLDLILGTGCIRTSAVIGFIANESISILENAGLIGVPLPGVFKQAIELLKGKGDKGTGSSR